VGWVGTIFVDPDSRGTGLGRALTEATLAILTHAGCATQVLVATDMGRPVYERLGFETRTFYQTFEREADATDGARPADEGIRPFTAADLADAVELDRSATGEDRGPLLAPLIGQEGSIVLRTPDGTLEGFLLRAPWGGGATIAVSPDAARRLFAERLRRAGPGHLVRVGTPLENEAGIAALGADGWRASYRPRRMERGPRPDWHPERIWGQFNMAVG